MARGQLNRHHLVQAAIATNTDTVIGFAPLAAGSELTNIWYDFCITGDTAANWNQAQVMTADCYVMRVPDPDDAPTDPNTLWDEMVPKAKDYTGVIEMDTESTALATPTRQPGDGMNLDTLFNGYEPLRIFERTTLIHALSPGCVPVSSTQYKPMLHLKGQIKRRVRVKEPSVVLFAVGAPDFNGSSYNAFTGGTNDRQEWIPRDAAEWMVLQELELAYDQFKLKMMGYQGYSTIPSTTEFDPVTAIEDLMRRTIEQIYEATAGRFLDQTWEAIGQTTYQITGSRPAMMNFTARA